MIDYLALKTKIDTDYPNSTEKEISIALNNENLAGKKAILSNDIIIYLFVHALWPDIKYGTSDAAKTAIDGLTTFPHFDITIAENETALINILDALVADSGIPAFTAAHKTGILELGDVTESWAQQNFGCPATIRDIRIAGNI